jgi:hypothetical protein
LRNKQYCFFNEQLNKEEYEEKKKLFFVQAKNSLVYAHATALWRNRLCKPVHMTHVETCSGDYITNAKNCSYCFSCKDSEDCRYCHDLLGGAKNEDCMDVSNFGIGAQLSYECQCIGGNPGMSFHVLFTNTSWPCHDLMYCHFCVGNTNHCFGCVGLKHKQYCILNKQYTKEEYESLVPQIIEKMMNTPYPSVSLRGAERRGNPNEIQDSHGIVTPLSAQEGGSGLTMTSSMEWGEFFPPSLSPFGYNETVAQEYYPLTKEEALSKGFNWSDYEPPPPQVDRVITREQMKKLPDNIKDIPDDILNWALTCEVTGKPYRIIKQELAFYREHNLPIPRRHPDQRHKDRMALRNPRKLYDRTCMKCGKPIKTTYAPDRPEIVYCEECYLKEIY